MKPSLRYETLTIFKSFTKKEFSEFEQFLSLTPFLNTIGGEFSYGKSSERKKYSKNLETFFKLLKPFYPDFSKLTNEYLLKKMRLKSLSLVKKNFSNLKLLCDHFLVLKEISTDKYYYDEALLYQLQARNLDIQFDRKYADVVTKLDNPSSFHDKDFLMKYNTGLIKFMRESQHFKLRSGIEIFKVMELQLEPSFNLLFFFVIDSIKVITNLIGHANGTTIDLNKIEFYRFFKTRFPNETIEYIIKKAIKSSLSSTIKKIIELYWLSYLFRTTKGKEAGVYFKRYIDILESVTPKLSLNEKYSLYHERHFGFWLALEFPEFEADEFRLYELYFKHKAYKATGKDNLQLYELKSIILRGDNTYRYEWTTKIMQQYLKEVVPEDQENLEHYRNAMLFFTRDQNYEASLKELRALEKKGHHTLTREILQLHSLIYYEQGHFDSALASIESLRKYLFNHQVGPATAVPFKKFITCFKKLVSNTISQRDDYESILAIINENNLMVSKKWLFKKISEQRAKLSSKRFRKTAS